MLQSLSIHGYKSIAHIEDLDLRRLNVIIGPNGAGKSNLLSLFRLLSFSLSDRESLPGYVGRQGGASKLLYGGPNMTRHIDIQLRFSGKEPFSFNEYSFTLSYAANDTFVYTDESFRYRHSGADHPAPSLGAGHSNPLLLQAAEQGNPTAQYIVNSLRRIIYHQFHNTSATSRMRQKWSTTDARHLKEDAGNLAAFLYRIATQHPPYYQRIRASLRQLLPGFDDFVFEPDYGQILLEWRESGSDLVFTASQASDGMLRIFALVALLQQPPADLPAVLILDEPELGLHPAAIDFIGALIRSASHATQIFIATQSPQLVDCFEPEDILIAERPHGSTELTRHTASELAAWLEDYSYSEIWRKNLVGGRP